MKKFKLFFLTLSLFLIGTLGNTAIASQQPTDKINDLIQKGLTEKQAVSLVKLEEKLKSAPRGSIKINDNTPELNDDEFKDEDKYFEKLLKLDPSAIKKGLNSQVRKFGLKDIENLASKNPGQSKYRVDYSDGTWIEMISKSIEETPRAPFSTKNIKERNKYFKPLGYTEKVISSYAGHDGSFTGSYTIHEYSGPSFADIWVKMTWTVTGYANKAAGNPVKATATTLTGGGSSAGVLEYATPAVSYVSTNTVATAKWAYDGSILVVQNISNPIISQNAPVIKLSGSINLEGVFAVNVSYNYTQYAIIKVWGSGYYQYCAGIYT